jgi:hypothetical protein
MTDHVGWRDFWWLNVGMHTIVFILLIFFFPETKWHRLHPSEIVQTAASSAENVATPAFKSDDPEDVTSSFPEDSPPPTTTITGYDPVLGQGKPSKQQFMPYQSHPAPFKTLLKEFIVPWRIMAFPIVEFAAFVVSWSASSFLTINLTQAQNFAAHPTTSPARPLALPILLSWLVPCSALPPMEDFQIGLPRGRRERIVASENRR